MSLIGALEIDVTISCPAWIEAVPGVEGACRDAARAAWAANAAVPPVAAAPPVAAEASLVLADDAFVRALNRDYRKLDEATNVLAFANAAAAGGDTGDDGALGAPRLLGDVVVAYETAAAEAVAEAKSLADHLCHLVVHGMLHLLGYDHRTAAEADRMESLEVQVLCGLGVASPYEDRAQQ